MEVKFLCNIIIFFGFLRVAMTDCFIFWGKSLTNDMDLLFIIALTSSEDVITTSIISNFIYYLYFFNKFHVNTI